MNIFLCGNTGIVNRGCEAIIRSSVKLLDHVDGEVFLGSDMHEADLDLSKELGINFISYNQVSVPQKIVNRIVRFLNRKTLRVEETHQVDLIKKIEKDDICLNIGGDTYCYGRPARAIALNRAANAKGAKTVLWCCSIEEKAITSEVAKDLNKYAYIFVRECLSEQNMIEKGIDKDKIVKVCDPAFFLDMKLVDLPTIFQKGPTIGINLSELVIRKGDSTVYNSFLGFINYVLDQTDYNICLIPHVYSIEKNICDWPIINRIQNDVISDRIAIVNKEYNCEELKYIISHCKYLYAARTHACIAAYSTFTPTIAIGYSEKSKGIAKDLFGDYRDYVIPYEEVKDKGVLIESFSFLEHNEDIIIQKLKNVIPQYKAQLINAIMNKLSITEVLSS